MSSKTIPPSPPNPHIAVMPAPVDKTLQPQYVTSPVDQIKLVDYPYNLVNVFTLTCYSKDLLQKNDMAVLYDSQGNPLSEAPVYVGETLAFGDFTYYSLYVQFTLNSELPSRDIKVRMPLELFGSSGGKDLYFRFSDYVKPDTIRSV